MAIVNLTDVDTVWYRVEETQIAHLAGIVDVQGTLSLRIEKDDSHRIGYTMTPELEIRRKNTDDDPVMGKITQYSEEHAVKFYIREDSNSNIVVVTIKRPHNVRRFLEPMIDHLVTNFIDAHLMLEQAIPALEDGAHLNKDGFYELVGIADALREGRTMRRGPKYTQEYFANEWSLTQ